MNRLLLITTLFTGACVQDDFFNGTLDTPAPVAVLDPTAAGRFPDATGPFDTPVGYVADRHGGRIRTLDLQRGRYLADGSVASFFRGNGLATGGARVLVAVGVVTPTPERVDVLAADARFAQLLRLPHIVGVDAQGRPEAAITTVTEQTWAGAGDLRLEGLRINEDRVTSETYTFTWNGAAFDVTSTRTGDHAPAFLGVSWTARTGAMAFVPRLDATPADGDTLTLTTDRGVEELDLPGTPVDLSVAPNQALAALIHADGSGAQTVSVFDPNAETLALDAPLDLPPTSRPVRVAWSADADRLWIADAGLGAVLEVVPGDTVPIVHPLPWPIGDVAPLTDADGVTRLYVTPIGRSEVWILRADDDTLLDVNPWTTAIDPMRFLSPVNGLAALPEPYDLPNDDEEARRAARTVAVSLQGGKVVWMEEQTGCLVSDRLPPRTSLVNASTLVADYEPDFPIQIPGTAYLQATEDRRRHILVNPCAGVAPQESWRVRFDGTVQAWTVEGSISGPQAGVAVEDDRYVSDDGEVSFFLQSGPAPSEDGWTFLFDVLDGVLEGDGDNQGDLVREVDLDNPGRPAVFYGFDEIDDEAKPWVVVGAQAADFVARIDATTGEVDAIWD